MNETQTNDSVAVEPTDEHQGESVGIDRTVKSDQKSMATILHSWIHDDQQPKREETSEFSMEVEQKVERRIASRFPEIAKLLLDNRSLSLKEVEPFGSIRTAIMAGIQEKWWLQWKKRWTFIPASKEEGCRVQMHKCMMRRTLIAKFFKTFGQLLPAFF